MPTEMSIRDAEALVRKNLPDWKKYHYGDTLTFAESLFCTYRDWAHDTLATTELDEEQFERTLEAWEIVAERYFNAMCKQPKCFETADGVTCYVGDTVYTPDEECCVVYGINESSVFVYRVGSSLGTNFDSSQLSFQPPVKGMSIKELREEYVQKERDERKSKQDAYDASIVKNVLDAMTDGDFEGEHLQPMLVKKGQVGIRAKGIGHVGVDGIKSIDPQAEEIFQQWEQRGVRVDTFYEGIILYVIGERPDREKVTWLEYEQ